MESFTDGMTVDFSAVTGKASQKGHEFNDIVPLHNADKEGKGGYANVLFADGHGSSVKDVGGDGDAPDGYLGAYKNSSGQFEINPSGFKDIRQTMWYGRMRAKPLPGGGSIE
ncbi:MAG TPA: hypothetical protein PLQ89_04130 [Phycisphaerae bacterium]|nr:hypothetical protein [Phycisphaerae bacterium]